MISILGFLAVYFSIRKPTEDERHGARPPAVRIATFAYGIHSSGLFRMARFAREGARSIVLARFAREGAWSISCVWYAFGAAAAAARAGRECADLARICRPSAACV